MGLFSSCCLDVEQAMWTIGLTIIGIIAVKGIGRLRGET